MTDRTTEQELCSQSEFSLKRQLKKKNIIMIWGRNGCCLLIIFILH
jgi:hypothetical protein